MTEPTLSAMADEIERFVTEHASAVTYGQQERAVERLFERFIEYAPQIVTALRDAERRAGALKEAYSHLDSDAADHLRRSRAMIAIESAW